jgi:hypothetical protein
MESEGSSPNSQELATCPYPEPDIQSIFFFISYSRKIKITLWTPSISRTTLWQPLS